MLMDKEKHLGRYKCPYNKQADSLAQTVAGLIQVTVLPPRILVAVLKLVYVPSILLLFSLGYSV